MPDEYDYPCGDTIELVSLRIEDDPVCIMCNGTGRDCDLTYGRILELAFERCHPCKYCGDVGKVDA
jgi:hypothetical protein